MAGAAGDPVAIANAGLSNISAPPPSVVQLPDVPTPSQSLADYHAGVGAPAASLAAFNAAEGGRLGAVQGASFGAGAQGDPLGVVSALLASLKKPTTKKSASVSKRPSPMGVLLDILSRPEQAITKAIGNVFDDETKGNAPNPAQDTGDFLKGLWQGGILDQGYTGAQLIQHAADDVNGGKHVTINPWLTGIGGFATDVVLDPLTYIPGPDVLTIGKKVIGGAGDILKAAKAGGDVAAAAKGAAIDLGKTTLQEVKKGPGAGGGGSAPAEAAAKKAADETASQAIDITQHPLYQMAAMGNPEEQAAARAELTSRGLPVPPVQALVGTTPEADLDADKVATDLVQGNATEAGKFTSTGHLNTEVMDAATQDRVRRLGNSMAEAYHGRSSLDEVPTDKSLIDENGMPSESAAVAHERLDAEGFDDKIRTTLALGRDRGQGMAFNSKSADPEMARRVAQYYKHTSLKDAAVEARKIAQSKGDAAGVAKAVSDIRKGNQAIKADLDGMFNRYDEMWEDGHPVDVLGNSVASDAADGGAQAADRVMQSASDAVGGAAEQTVRDAAAGFGLSGDDLTVRDTTRPVGRPATRAPKLSADDELAKQKAEVKQNLLGVDSLLGDWSATGKRPTSFSTRIISTINANRGSSEAQRILGVLTGFLQKNMTIMDLAGMKTAQGRLPSAVNHLLNNIGISEQDVKSAIVAFAKGDADKEAETAAAEAAGRDVEAQTAREAAAKEQAAKLGADYDAQVAAIKAGATKPGAKRPMTGDLLIDSLNGHYKIEDAARQALAERVTTGLQRGVEGEAVPEVHDVAHSLAARALDQVLTRKFKRPTMPVKDMKWEQVKGGLWKLVDSKGRTHEEMFRNEINGEDQATLYHHLSRMTTAYLKKASGKYSLGKDSADAFKAAATLRALRIVEKTLDDWGIPVYMGVGPEKIPLKLSDVMRIMLNEDASHSGKEFLAKKMLFNGGSSVPWGNFGEAVVAAVKGRYQVSAGKYLEKQFGVRAALEKTESKFAATTGKSYSNGLLGKFSNDSPKLKAFNDAVRRDAEARTNQYLQKFAQDEQSRLLDVGEGESGLVTHMRLLIDKSLPSIRAAMDTTAAEYTAKYVKAVKSLTSGQLAMIDQKMAEANESGTVGTLIQAASSRDRVIADEGFDIGAPQDAVDTTANIADGLITEAQDTQSKTATATLTARGAGDDAAARQANYDAAREADEDLNAVIGDDPEMAGADDIQMKAEDVNNRTRSSVFYTVASAFSRGYGTGPMHAALRKSDALVAGLRKVYLSQYIDPIRKAFGRDQTNPNYARLMEAWNAITHGVARDDLGPEAAAAYDSLAPAVHILFGDPSDASVHSAIGSVFSRGRLLTMGNERALSALNNELVKEWLNDSRLTTEQMEKFNGFFYDATKATDAASKNGTYMIDELAKQWMTAPVSTGSDVLRFLEANWRAYTTLAARTTFVDDFMHTLGELENGTYIKGWGKVHIFSDHKEPGLVPVRSEVPNVNGKGTFHGRLAPYFRPGTYIHPDAQMWLERVENLLEQQSQSGTALGRFMDDYYGPLNSIWKSSLTVMRPAHHIDNLIGDSIMTLLANGGRHFIKANRLAISVLSNRTYKDVDLIAAAMGEHVPLGDEDVLFRTRGGHAYSAKQLRQAIETQAILPSYHSFANLDLEESAAMNRVQKFSGAVNHSRVVKGMGSVLEWRDHQGRTAHFLQFVMQNANKFHAGYKNADEADRALFTAAAYHVRQWHPDGQDLTEFERRYMTRIIPFYSWMRKAAPMVLQSTIRRPGRVLATYQASYNLGVAGGANPKSLASPYEDDQAFPSFLTSKGYGPQFKLGDYYYGINPAVPTFDLLSETFNPNELLGSLNPIAKIPLELSTKTDLATGSPITHWGDYVDDQIPGVSLASHLSGISATATLANLVLGRTSPYTGTAFEPNHDISLAHRGNGAYQAMSALNYLTGARSVEWNQPNYVSDAIKQHSAINQLVGSLKRKGLS